MTAGCGLFTDEAAAVIDGTPLIATLLKSAAEGFGTQIGTTLASMGADAIMVGARPLVSQMKKYLGQPDVTQDQSKTPPVIGYAAGPMATGPLALASALWRTKDGQPASHTMGSTDAGVVGIPTPAQFGVTLLAVQHVTNWKNELEAQGQCVSMHQLLTSAGQIFAPSQGTSISTGSVTDRALTQPAEYIYWTTGGASVSVTWTPSLDKKTNSHIAASYKQVPGGPALELPVADFEREFGYDELWSTSSSSSSPIALNSPQEPPSYSSDTTLPLGSGDVGGLWEVHDNKGASTRTVTANGVFTNQFAGSFTVNLTGAPSGGSLVTPLNGLPMTMTLIPGDCAIYSGDATVASDGTVNAKLGGPAGIVLASLRLTSAPQPGKPFLGIMTLTSG